MNGTASVAAAPITSMAQQLLETRIGADTWCRQQLDELRALAGSAAEIIRAGLAAALAGAPAGSAPVTLALGWAGQERRILELMALVAVKGAILSGRWPEEREAEASARCADEDGLFAFLDAMEKVPIGFVDVAMAAPVQH